MVFLNHGSFGSCPIPVWQSYHSWQLRMELQPVEFFAEKVEPLLVWALEELARFVGAGADRMAFVTNATVACNMLAGGWPAEPGDEVLGNDHEYGACERAWRYHCGRRGLTYRQARLTPGPDCARDLVEQASDRTRILFLSHLTSPSALVLPVAEIASLARARGIVTIVDGAHAPGQLDLDIASLGVDAYFGNLHKWLNTPKGTAFLWVDPRHALQPLVAGWGWDGFDEPEKFSDWHQRWGTRDLAAFLAVPAALDYHREKLTPAVRRSCRELVEYFLQAMGTGAYPSPEWHAQLGTARLPLDTDCDALKKELLHRHGIEIPVFRFLESPCVRLSVQAYNSRAQVDYLLEALGHRKNSVLKF